MVIGIKMYQKRLYAFYMCLVFGLQNFVENPKKKEANGNNVGMFLNTLEMLILRMIKIVYENKYKRGIHHDLKNWKH